MLAILFSSAKFFLLEKSLQRQVCFDLNLGFVTHGHTVFRDPWAYSVFQKNIVNEDYLKTVSSICIC